jgi:alpha-glucosidase
MDKEAQPSRSAPGSRRRTTRDRPRRPHPVCEGLNGDLLSLTRNPGFRCVVNLSTEPIRLPAHGTALLASEPFDGSLLPPDTAI